MKEIKRLGIAGAVTETNFQEGGIKFELADKYGLSWMHWSYKTFSDWTGDHGIFDMDCTSTNILDCVNHDPAKTIDNSTMKNYARTYAQAVAGKTSSFTYNDTTSIAILEYVPKADCKLPTEIFVSETYVYTNGFEVEVTGDLADHVTWTNPKKNYIFVTVDQEFFDDNSADKTVTITIKQKEESIKFMQD